MMDWVAGFKIGLVLTSYNIVGGGGRGGGGGGCFFFQAEDGIRDKGM